MDFNRTRTFSKEQCGNGISCATYAYSSFKGLPRSTSPLPRVAAVPLCPACVALPSPDQDSVDQLQYSVGRSPGSEPRLSETARPSSPICRSVRSAGLQSSVVVLAWICSVEMAKDEQKTTAVVAQYGNEPYRW